MRVLFYSAMRGHFRSRRFGSVISEAEQLVKKGVKEIILVAPGFIALRRDLGQTDGLAHLWRELTHVDGIEWVRGCIPTRRTSAIFPYVIATDRRP